MKHGPWKPPPPAEPDRWTPPLEDHPATRRHTDGDRHLGQRAKAKRRARRRAKR